MTHFAGPALARNQIVLLPTTVDDAIPQDHPVRILDESLGRSDWQPWAVHDPRRRGQPPLPPRVVATAIL